MNNRKIVKGIKYSNFKYLLLTLILVIFNILGIKAQSKKAVEINFLMPAPFAESTKDLVKEFNQDKNNKINIKVTKGPLETESVSDLAISSLLLGDNSFDVILIDITWLPKYAAAGWLVSLDQFIEKGEWESLAPGARLGNSYENKIYRWPFVADMGLLYWRSDLMPEPPKTPEELIDISLKLKQAGKVKYGYVWQGRQYEGLICVFLEVLNAFGGGWINDSNEITLSNKKSIQAANWLKRLISSGVSPKSVTNFSETEALQAFKEGNAALMRNWPYAWAELQKESSAVKGKVSIANMIAKNNQVPVSTLGSWGFSVLQGSKNKSEAYRAIKYLTSTNSQKRLFLNNGYTPTRIDLFKDKELISNSPILAMLGKALSSAKPRPETPYYAQISNILQTQISAILTDNKPIDEAMKLAEIKTRQIISSSGQK